MDSKSVFEFEEQFEKFSNENSWQQVFRLLNKNSHEKYSSKKTTVAKKIKNFKLNRYVDVVPFDDSRVKLTKLDNDYINASLIKVDKAERNYILTQGPLKKTISHFWLMVWEQNSRAIVMLNKLIENDVEKCDLYWPTKSNNLKFDDVDLEVEMISEKEDNNNYDFIIREFRLRNTKENEDRSIFHFQTLCWPDFNVPKSPESFVNFFYTVEQSGLLNSNKYGPAIIHCSAGIGRSGTFILVDSFLILLKKSIKQNETLPDILDLLLEMRNYRAGLVQTHNQLKFAYEAIINAKNSEYFGEEKVAQLDVQEDKELRRRIREEKRQTTMEHIKRIKNKKIEIENQNKQKLIIKYVGLIFFTIFAGGLYYKSSIN